MIKVTVAACMLVACSGVAHAAATQTVAITLEDPSVNPSVTGMVIKAEPATVKAGRVTLEAINRSKDLVHEVLVVAAPPKGKRLTYDQHSDVVSESKVRSLGEVSDLAPGAHGKLTLNLRPGTYLLFCNQPGHFKSGMSTELVVEK